MPSMPRLRYLSFFVLLVAGVGASAQLLPTPKNDLVFLAEDVPAQAGKVLVGRGIPLPDGLSTPASVDGRGNQIVWRLIREHTDARGGRHAFYRQDLVSGSTVAELYGSEVGLHYSKAGKLWTAAGNQFTAAVPTNRVTFSAADAIERVVLRLHEHPTFFPEPPGRITAEQRAWRTANTGLKLVGTGPATFRYAWFTFANDVNGVEHGVVIDAETEEILAIGELHPSSNCHPTTPWQSVAAVGEPVRPDLRNSGVRRSLRANVTNDRPAPFTREAFWQYGPLVSITQETDNDAFQCDPNVTGPAYTLYPVAVDGTTPTYRDRGDEWQGSAAGDALHNTIETMAAFNTLGRSSWNGLNGDANVVLQSTFGGDVPDQAFFRMTGSGDPRVPPTPFLGIGRALDFHNTAAALDVIAHEWGHGVIFSSANFPCTTAGSIGCQMHEGFADVIGTTVEKLRQPAGNQPEQSSDWTIHEDNGAGGYHRGAEDDVDGHGWVRLNGTEARFNHFVHRQDITGAENNLAAQQQQHARGTMLHMVLRLMSNGGENPICSREPTYQGCGTISASVGVAKASQILFDTVAYYAPSTAHWAELATYASVAAFDLYSDCTASPLYHASGEQIAVHRSFEKIGYPRLTDANRCQ